MLYHLLFPLSKEFGVLNVFRYISFRCFGAALCALVISLMLGPWMIRRLALLQMGQVIREEGPESHKKKKGTPTMGGVLILFSLVVSTLLWADLRNPSLWIVLFVTVGYGILGFVDDYQKVVQKSSKGVSARQKLAVQTVIAVVAMWMLMEFTTFVPDLRFPFFKDLVLHMGWFFIPFATFVLVGASNAVNLTDGLDGLAIGPVITTTGTFMILAYLSGHVKLAEYLEIPYVAGTGELAIFAASVAAAGLGFLWFNSHPAQVFMGDVGSLSLGGAIGALAVVTKNEILLLIVGGVFVTEALSVMIQVVSFKTRGKRVFKMAPIHHHFELLGWPESKVIVRFWIISIILAIVALSTLKLR
jgi:phospho-N-acetylmuramoyl-pentapeptide-transferase